MDIEIEIVVSDIIEGGYQYAFRLVIGGDNIVSEGRAQACNDIIMAFDISGACVTVFRIQIKEVVVVLYQPRL